MLLSNMPALTIVLPLLVAPLCTLCKRDTLPWLLSLCVSAVVLALVGVQFTHVFSEGALFYELGGWARPLGIEYRVDRLSVSMLLIVALIGFLSLLYSKQAIEAEIAADKRPLFYTAFMLCFAGLMGIAITNDAFNIYVFLEISSLATYALVAMGKDRRALMAAYEYLILGSIGATFILVGVGLIYMATGTLNITDLATRIHEVGSNSLMKASLAFFSIGLALKIAMFPLHLWLANAYTNAPSVVSIFLSATATKVGIYVLLRVTFCIFGYQFVFEEMPIKHVFMTFSAVAMVVGAMVAIFQQNIKRLLAYSSVSQIGYIVLAISLGTEDGLVAGGLHILSHAVTKAVLFMAVGAMALRVSGVRLSDLRGLGYDMPLTSLVFVIGGLSLVGIPLTTGFVSKWYLLQATFGLQAWYLFMAIVANSLLAVTYFWRVIEVLYFHKPATARAAIKEAPLAMQLSMWSCVGIIVGFGIFAGPMVEYAQLVADYLIHTKF